ncbi:MAG: hypothetical protein R3C20_03185 [Planctomycetaceae bacterium]
MKIIAGRIIPDDGVVDVQPDVVITQLNQEVPDGEDKQPSKLRPKVSATWRCCCRVSLIDECDGELGNLSADGSESLRGIQSSDCRC